MELAISYKRFSSPAQARGRSEGRQHDETEAYCARKGYSLVEQFVDRGVSAYKGENSDSGDLKAIIDLARAGRIKRGTHIVVESLDRLSRQEITAALALFLSIIVDAGLVIDSTFDDQIYTKERCDADPFAAMGAILVFMRGNNESRTWRHYVIGDGPMPRRPGPGRSHDPALVEPSTPTAMSNGEDGLDVENARCAWVNRDGFDSTVRQLRRPQVD